MSHVRKHQIRRFLGLMFIAVLLFGVVSASFANDFVANSSTQQYRQQVENNMLPTHLEISADF